MILPSALQLSDFTELPNGAGFYWVANKFIWVFLYDVMEKPKQTFWSSQYFPHCDFSVPSNNRQPSSQGASLPSSWGSTGPQAVTRSPRLRPPRSHPPKGPKHRIATLLPRPDFWPLSLGGHLPPRRQAEKCHDRDLTRNPFQFPEHSLLLRVLDLLDLRVTEADPGDVTRKWPQQASKLGFCLHTTAPQPCSGHYRPG